jgi:hypothetical protein
MLLLDKGYFLLCLWEWGKFDCFNCQLDHFYEMIRIN